MENRIGLFADDIIVFISRLEQSLQNLLDTIDKFVKLSGYKLNISKSAILFLRLADRLNPPIQTLFKMVLESFTYLGIQMSTNIDNLINASSFADTKSVTESIDRRLNRTISMIGRINIIKMNILPKFLYLSQSIPLSPPVNCFAKMRSMFCRFIWNNKRARLHISLSYLPYETPVS